MRNYLEIPKEFKKKNLLIKSRDKTDIKILEEFIAFIYCLGFKSDKIRRLIYLESLTLISKE